MSLLTEGFSYKAFDAFPKVAPQHTVRSSKGGSSTIFLIVSVLFIAYVQIGSWFDGYTINTFTVDSQVQDTIDINMDMVVNMPCQFLHTNVLDLTNDRTLAAHYLNFEGINFFVPEEYSITIDDQPPINERPKYATPNFDEIKSNAFEAQFREKSESLDHVGAPACRIFGNIPVAALSGNFHITAKDYKYMGGGAHVPPSALNFSHVFYEFSFGVFYPFLNNPLEFTSKITTHNFQSYTYFLNAVPTTYSHLGTSVNTYQYSMTELQVYSDGKIGSSFPGIFINYDFEPIRMIFEEERIGFIAFVMRLVSIFGGIIICFSWIYRGIDKLASRFLGKRWTNRGVVEKPQSLLDE